MGRKSREHRERREQRALAAGKPAPGSNSDNTWNDRIDKLEAELNRLTEGDAVLHRPDDCPDEAWESNLKDILAFESVSTGTSLFDGLQKHGIDLPPPEKIDDRQCAEKAKQVLDALADLRVFVCGYEDMTSRTLYSTLWNQTLWEGCYVEKQNPAAVTLIDVSHKMLRSEMLSYLDKLSHAGMVQ